MVAALREAKIPVRQVYWVHYPLPAEWRLVIVTPLVDTQGPRDVYVTVQQSTARAEDTLPLQRIVVIGPDDPLARELALALTPRGGRAVQTPTTFTSTVQSTASTGLVDAAFVHVKK